MNEQTHKQTKKGTQIPFFRATSLLTGVKCCGPHVVRRCATRLGFHWFSMIPIDFQWFPFVSIVALLFQWFPLVSNGFRWFPAFPLIDFIDFQCFSLISNGCQWFPLIPNDSIGIHWFPLFSIAFHWCPFIDSQRFKWFPLIPNCLNDFHWFPLISHWFSLIFAIPVDSVPLTFCTIFPPFRRAAGRLECPELLRHSLERTFRDPQGGV